MEKKKLLFCGITMNCAGTEKAFLSLLDEIDFDRYDVDLLLAKKEGLLMPLIPKQVRVIGGMEYGEMFLLSSKNAIPVIWRSVLKKSPLMIFPLIPYFFKIILVPAKRSFTATRMWCRILRKFRSFSEEFGIDTEYDAALAFWGDRSMFYMCDKVRAKKKLAWLHFDYAHPPRDNELYLDYFNRCDYVINVSTACHEALVNTLPQIADKCVMMENIRSPLQIRQLAEKGETFTDTDFDGTRILSVMRICEQKGSDFIAPVLAKLVSEGHNVKWYIVGGGDDAAVAELKASAERAGISDRLALLGTTDNPYGYIRDADIFALPSRYEGKPITVEEAKMLCKPIAVTNYLSAEEQLNMGEYGVIGGEGEEGIYTALKTLLTSPELRDALVEKLKASDFGNSDEMNKFYGMIE